MKQDQIFIYEDEKNAIQLEVRMAGEMIWLNRQQLATLFGRDYKTISKHINNALKEELADEVVVAKFANTTQHGAIEGKTQTHVSSRIRSFVPKYALNCQKCLVTRIILLIT